MGFFQACKDFLGIESGYDEYDDNDMFYEEAEDNYYEEEEKHRAVVTETVEEEEPLMDGGFFSGKRFAKKPDRAATERTVNRASAYTGSNLKVVLCNPTEFDNCPMICGHLRSHMTVVLNLENVKSATEKRRIFDFVSGCCFALDCNIRKISEPVYVVAPASVDLLSEIDFQEATNSASYFDTDYGF